MGIDVSVRCGTGGAWPLYISRAVGGACYGFYTAGYTYIADISEEKMPREWRRLNPSII